MFKRLLMVALLVVAPLAAQRPNQSAYSMMQDAAQKTFQPFEERTAEDQAGPELPALHRASELMPFALVKYAGARWWRAVTTRCDSCAARSYFTAFRLTWSKAYDQALAMCHGQTCQIAPEQPLGNADIVAIRVTIIDSGGRPPVRLDFNGARTAKPATGRRMSMIAEGVSMITTKQNEWASTLRTQGIDGLTKQPAGRCRAAHLAGQEKLMSAALGFESGSRRADPAR